MAVQMSVLVGDTTGNRIVNSSDIGETKAVSGTVAASRNDVTVNGVINASDISLVKSKSGYGSAAMKLSKRGFHLVIAPFRHAR